MSISHCIKMFLWSIATHKDHFVRRLSVPPSVCDGSHTFLVVTHSYVSQVTYAFLGMLPLCFVLWSIWPIYRLDKSRLTSPSDVILTCVPMRKFNVPFFCWMERRMLILITGLYVSCPCFEMLKYLGLKKKICLFPVTCLKILGSVGRKNIFFYFLFFFKKWLPNCFSNIFCFFYIQITVITIQIGNRCGLWGILCSIDHKTVSLSNR